MITIEHVAHLGNALRRLRIAARMTQADVHDQTGLLNPQLSRWENGRDMPKLDGVVKYLTAVGADLVDLQRALIGEEEEKRRAAVARQLRDSHAASERRLASSCELRLAMRQIMKPSSTGLERFMVTSATPAPGAARKAHPAMERLLDGLPESLEELLAHPARHRPAVVERLMEEAEVLLAAGAAQGNLVADAARQLAAELPGACPRQERLRLRAGSLATWGTAQRIVDEPAAAEAAFLLALDLLSQTEAAEPAGQAVLLGQCALVASDQENDEELARYAAESIGVAKAADRGWPLPTFLHLWKTMMAAPKKQASAVRLARALFQAASDAWDGFAEVPWTMSLEIEQQDDGGCEIRLLREGPAPDRPQRTLKEPVIVRSGPRSAKGGAT